MVSDLRKDVAIIARLFHEGKRYWPHIVGLFLLNALATPLQLLVPVPVKIAVDSAIGSDPLPAFFDLLVPSAVTGSSFGVLVFAAVLVVVVAVATELQGLVTWVFQTYTGDRLDRDFRSALFRHAQRQSISGHEEKGTFDSLYRVTQDGEALKIVVLERLLPMIAVFISLVGTMTVMFRIDWQLALIGLSVTPIILFTTETYRPRLRKRWQNILQLRSTALSVVHESLSALRVVKAFGQEEREHRRFLDQSDDMIRSHLKVTGQEGVFSAILGLTTAAGSAIVLFVGVLHVFDGAITLGELLMVMAYLRAVYAPIRRLGWQVGNLQASLASLERAFAVLDQQPDVVDRPGGKTLRRARGAVTFEDVSFAYTGSKQVLKNVAFHVDGGDRCGIVGPSGAGKSTLISLLMRFYDPAAGRILLDGVDLRDYRLADLRAQFAIVLQEPVLFSTSVGENIAYGRPEATADEIIKAAKAANAHDFIADLPNGYETVLGERGMSLSGGQRQRVSLARAFLKDAPILILDEPTSAVDMKTETGILEALNTLMENRTTFIIAHRTSTLTNCDTIIRISQGEASIESGISREMISIDERKIAT